MELLGEAGNRGQKENSLPTQFVVSCRPKEYLTQGKVHCGQYSAWAILSAYGLVTESKPLALSSPLGLISGLTTPKMMVSMLTKHGMTAEMKTANKLSDEEKLNALKKELAKDKPVALMVSQGYKSNGGHSKLWQNTTLHWITVWGYDDKTRAFFLYNPLVKTSRHDKNIPIGNVTRTYEQVLRDWRGWALPIFERYRYITVRP